jgi:hypothetical protein
MHELADELGCEELHELAEATRRQSLKPRRAAPTRMSLSPRLAPIVREYAKKHPDMSNRDIGEHFGLDGGRVSEAINFSKGY